MPILGYVTWKDGHRHFTQIRAARVQFLYVVKASKKGIRADVDGSEELQLVEARMLPQNGFDNNMP